MSNDGAKELARLEHRLATWKSKLPEARAKDTERFSRIPFGAGMRWGKIPSCDVNERRVKAKIAEVEARIKEITTKA